MLQSNDEKLIADKIIPADFEKWVPKVDLSQCNFDELMESLVDFTQYLIGTDGLVLARENFFTAMGKSFHTDASYESRMQYFQDYLVFENAVKIDNDTLRMNAAQRFQGHRLVPNTTPGLNALLGGFHSIFHIDKVRDQKMWVTDLLTNKSHEIVPRDNELFTGFQKKIILQGYLFTDHGKTYISRGFIAHPIEAAKVIKKYLKKSRDSHNYDPMIIRSRLARQQIRHLRLMHVSPKIIYESDPR